MEGLEILFSVRKALGFEKKLREFTTILGYTNHKSYRHIERGTIPFNQNLKKRLSKIYRVNPTYLSTGKGRMFLKPGETFVDEDEKKLISQNHEYNLRLYLFRKYIGLTQAQMAVTFGCSTITYSHIESGKVELSKLQISILEQMSKNIRWLNGGKGKLFQNKRSKVTFK